MTIRNTAGAILLAALAVLAVNAATLLFPVPLYAQDAVTVTTDVVEVAPEPMAPDTTVLVNEPAGDTIVTIPVDDIVTKILGWLRDIVITAAIAAVGWAGRLLPKTVVNWLMQTIVERNLARAVDYGINAVEGAVKGVELRVDVGSAVIAEALQYAMNHAPGWIIRWLGGPEKIRDMIIARIPLDSEATAEKVAVALGNPPDRDFF